MCRTHVGSDAPRTGIISSVTRFMAAALSRTLPPPMTARDRTEITYRYERWRALSTGIIEAAGTTFLLLIAVRGFDAGRTAKALVAGGGSLGLMLAPWLVSRVEALGWPVAKAASRLAAIGAISFVVMAALP